MVGLLTPVQKLSLRLPYPTQEVPGVFFPTSVYDLAEVQASFRGRVKHGISYS